MQLSPKNQIRPALLRDRVWLAVLLSCMPLGACGDGIGDGSWDTLYFSDFAQSDGPLDMTGFTFVLADPADAIAVGSEKLQFQAASLNAPALFFSSAVSSGNVRSTVELDPVEVGAARNFAMLAMTPGTALTGLNGTGCSIANDDMILYEIVDDDSVPMDTESSIAAWTLGTPVTMTLTVNEGTATCAMRSGTTSVTLQANYTKRTSGHVGILNTGSGSADRTDVDSWRVEIR